MSKVKVLITNDQKKVKVPTGIRLLIRRCCMAALQLEGLSGNFEVSVTFVDNERIHQLNLEHRGIDRPTDVLSFPQFDPDQIHSLPQTEEPLAIGDIVISMEKAFEQAQSFGHSIQREVGFLTVHSMFHLLGYDHEEGGLKAVQMREKEETVLGELGISRNATYLTDDEIE